MRARASGKFYRCSTNAKGDDAESKVDTAARQAKEAQDAYWAPQGIELAYIINLID